MYKRFFYYNVYAMLMQFLLQYSCKTIRASYLKFSISYGTRVWKHVTDVVNTGKIHHQALESKTKACMAATPVFA